LQELHRSLARRAATGDFHKEGGPVNLPNWLTISRIFFVPLLVAVMVQERIPVLWGGVEITSDLLALVIFLIAAATDLLDGYLARRWKQVTTIGTLLDPIADKLLVSAALISLVQVGAIRGWLVVLLVGREFAVSGLRSIAAAEGYTISANELGKTKTFFQVVSISLLIWSIHHPGLVWWANLSLYVVVFFSLASAVSYFLKFWKRIDVRVKHRTRTELLQVEREKQRALIVEKRAAAKARRQARLNRRAAKTRAANSDPAKTGEFAPRPADRPTST
jgi:CDP-diacylglycerol--glycerol-3-phosphate 3-phosphatidyltransferase